jgi:hypothetical protein
LTAEIVRLETDLNAHVYELFDVAPKEIQIIEESTKYNYGEVVGLAIPVYAGWRGVSGARGMLVASGGVTNAFVVLSEALRPGGDLSRAWRALRERPG